MSLSARAVGRSTGWGRVWKRVTVTLAVVALIVEVVIGAPIVVRAAHGLRAGAGVWMIVAVVSSFGAMSAYARMQRRLLRAAGARIPLRRHVQLAYAAHAVSVTLPGGPAFATELNYRQMRRFGATPSAASWCIAVSALLSAATLLLVTVAAAATAGATANLTTTLTRLGVVVAVSVAVGWAVRRRPAAATLTRLVTAVELRVRPRSAPSIAAALSAVLADLGRQRVNPIDLMTAGLAATANWVRDAAALWLSCRAAGLPELPTAGLTLTYCAAMTAGSLPVVPGGLGVIDGALTLGLTALGAPAAQALTAVVLYRIVSLGLISGAGWLAWLSLHSRAERTGVRGAGRPRQG